MGEVDPVKNQEPGMPLYCPSCLKHGVRTPLERHRKQALRYCTFHYWLMRGRGYPEVYTLKAYSQASAPYGFKISFPSEEDRRIMLEADHKKTL
jgi:hypothetical protein